MDIIARLTHYNPDGTKNGDSAPFTAKGIRIPLEVLLNTAQSLPIP
jgi:hypothetical protein